MTMPEDIKAQSHKDRIVNELAEHYRAILELIGEDPSREGLVKTPLRAAKAMYFASQGYRNDLDETVSRAVFTHEGSQMVVVKDIEFYSFCEHHILPFFGTISVAYMPQGKILGLSKLARIVDHYARRLQVQERLTAEVCDEVMRRTGAKGVIAVANARHLCMQMRGVEKQNSSTTTMHCAGVFETEPALRAEFFAQL